MTQGHPLSEHNKLVAELTDKYRNPPYSLPFALARQYALREAIALSRGAGVPAQMLYR